VSVDRRSLLKSFVAAGAAAVAGEATSEARVRAPLPADALGLLYDTTRCIGCKTCVVACREANGTKPDTSNSPGGIWDTPIDLNGQTKTVIKLYKSADGHERSFFKAQCMHCVDPACTNACMLGALKKREHGIVSYNPNLCIGCRYCQMACPFNVPKFEWGKTFPKIVKCELCRHRAAGASLSTIGGFSRYPKGHGPACAEVCPRDAVIYGTRQELLAEARRRLAANPDRYVPKIYGETDGGGTQCLYLSHVPFEKLGLPKLTDQPVPEVQQAIQHGIYQGFVAPVVLYGLLGAVMFRNRKKAASEETSAEKGGEL
jgi:Fe-S-cluster-containing dehydrogenase component